MQENKVDENNSQKFDLPEENKLQPTPGQNEQKKIIKNVNHNNTKKDLSNEILYFSINQDSKSVTIIYLI